MERNNALNTNLKCVDTDGGYFPFLRGYAEWFNRNGEKVMTEDLCIDNQLMEVVCGKNGFADNTQTYVCPNGCVDGACVN